MQQLADEFVCFFHMPTSWRGHDHAANPVNPLLRLLGEVVRGGLLSNLHLHKVVIAGSLRSGRLQSGHFVASRWALTLLVSRKAETLCLRIGDVRTDTPGCIPQRGGSGAHWHLTSPRPGQYQAGENVGG